MAQASAPCGGMVTRAQHAVQLQRVALIALPYPRDGRKVQGVRPTLSACRRSPLLPDTALATMSSAAPSNSVRPTGWLDSRASRIARTWGQAAGCGL